MGTELFPGRFTAHTDDPFVLFMIGMRLNRLSAIRKAFYVAKEFTKMRRELEKDPQKGLLGGRTILYARGLGMVQYWRSYEDLESWARSSADAHMPGWRGYNQLIGNDGSCGVWHETYLVDPGKVEVVYDNMPAFGLGSVMKHVPATGHRETAGRRLGGDTEPAVPSPPQPTE